MAFCCASASPFSAAARLASSLRLSISASSFVASSRSSSPRSSILGTAITLALNSSIPPGGPSSMGVWTALVFRLRVSRPVELRVLIVRRLDTLLPVDGRLPRFLGAMLPVFPELVSVSGPEVVFRRSKTIANSSSSGIASSSSSDGNMSPLLLKLSIVSLLPAVPLLFLPCRLGALPMLPSLSSNSASPSPRSLPGRFAPG